jgi:hypothetical protein
VGPPGSFSPVLLRRPPHFPHPSRPDPASLSTHAIVPHSRPCRAGAMIGYMTAEDYAKGRRALLRRDPVLARSSGATAPCGLGAARDRFDHFAMLVRAIVFQQLSTKAATTIHDRLLLLMPGDPSPELPGGAGRRAAAIAPGSAVRRPPTFATCARRCRPARCRSTRWTHERRGGHRGAHGDQGRGPLDGGDVPHLPAAAPRRAARGRSRDHQRRAARLPAAQAADPRPAEEDRRGLAALQVDRNSWYLWRSLDNAPVKSPGSQPDP